MTYGFRYRHKETGRQHWIGLGIDLAPEQARARALKVAAQAKNGEKPPSSAEVTAKWRKTLDRTVNDVLDDYIARYARPNSRSVDQIERALNVDVRPKIGEKAITELRRLDIVELLDGIEDRGSPVAADRTLAYLRKALRWYATRDDTFVVPIVPGMARTKPKERARTPHLERATKSAISMVALDAIGSDAPKCFPCFVRTLLLTTAQRLAHGLQSAVVPKSRGNEWTVPPRGKRAGLDHLVPLTDAVVEYAGRAAQGLRVFQRWRQNAVLGFFKKSRRPWIANLPRYARRAGRKPVPRFTFHDLRLYRAQSDEPCWLVDANVAERVLGHVIPGVRGTYDRYEYRVEKRAALEKLDVQVTRILHPDKAVIRFPKDRNKR